MRIARRARGEAGATTELIVAFPALFFLIFIGIQFALWFHASHVALAAAEEGARAARVCDQCSIAAAQSAGTDRANVMLDNLAPTILSGRQVTSSVDANRNMARVDVRANAVSLLPGFSFQVHEFSEGPIEKFRAENAP